MMPTPERNGEPASAAASMSATAFCVAPAGNAVDARFNRRATYMYIDVYIPRVMAIMSCLQPRL